MCHCRRSMWLMAKTCNLTAGQNEVKASSQLFQKSVLLLLPCMCIASGVKWLVLVSIYIIYICGFLKLYISVRLTFQTFAVGLLVEFIDQLYHCAFQKRFPRRVDQGFSCIMHTLLQSQLRSHKLIGKYRHLAHWPWKYCKSIAVADQTTSRIVVDWERMWMWGAPL